MAQFGSLVSGLVLGILLGVVAPADAAAHPAASTSVAARSTLTPGSLGSVGSLPARLLLQSSLERQVVALTNRERRRHGCRPLTSRSSLRKAARAHTMAMATRETMSHRLPGEAAFGTRISRAGYRSWNLVAENVARGFANPTAVMRAWMASPGHRRNIVDCRLRDIGVGVVLKDGRLWWTQNFGRR